MTSTTSQLDTLMETASEALARMDYLVCEQLCQQALAIARSRHHWDYYARILLPLQEARRQRRMIAAEGVVRLGTDNLGSNPVLWLRRLNAGCMVVTKPHTCKDAVELAQAVRRQSLCVEVLWADNPASDRCWTLRSFAGPNISYVIPAPPAPWVNTWMAPDTPDRPIQTASSQASQNPGAPQPVDWFLEACEALGDAALEQVQTPVGNPRRVRLLERCLQVVTDHEILHQALGDAARALRGGAEGC